MSKTMKEMMAEYLDSKQQAWADSTLRSEEHRLNAVADKLDGDAEKLWKHCQKTLSPYSAVTTFIRVISFWNYLIAKGYVTANPYANFKTLNARRFKNTYQPKRVGISYEEAFKRVMSLQDEAIRNKALLLLTNGLRYTESGTLKDGEVKGKGSKMRKVFGAAPQGAMFAGSYRTFLEALKKVGLKPHDLRKLCATRLVQAGLREADLCKVMGWESIATAKYYLQPMEDDKLRDVFNAIQGGIENGKEQAPREVQKAS